MIAKWIVFSVSLIGNLCILTFLYLKYREQKKLITTEQKVIRDNPDYHTPGSSF